MCGAETGKDPEECEANVEGLREMEKEGGEGRGGEGGRGRARRRRRKRMEKGSGGGSCGLRVPLLWYDQPCGGITGSGLGLRYSLANCFPET